MRRFVDEDGNMVTMEDIKARFEELKASGELDEDAKLAVYIRDVTGKDGFLTEI